MRIKELEALKEIQKFLLNTNVSEEIQITLKNLINLEEKRFKKTQTEDYKELKKKRCAEYYQRNKEIVKLKRRQRYIDKGY